MTIADISVVCANYNNATFLPGFFDAWIKSSIAPREILFVDDGSKDDSVAIARDYQKVFPYLQVIELNQNRGFGNALNAGVAHATGKYILRIDPDDVTMPDRLEKQLHLLESGQADVVGSNAIFFQSNTGKEVGVTNFPIRHEDIAKTILRGEHGILHSTVMARVELFRKHPYLQGNVPAEDYDIFARMLRSGARFANISEPLLRCRIHQLSVSNILPFSTIAKTYQLRDQIFGTRTSRLAVILYYTHIKFYRKFLFAPNKTSRLMYLALASILRPDKAFKRVLPPIRLKYFQ